jgi:hypothetical protein
VAAQPGRLRRQRRPAPRVRPPPGDARLLQATRDGVGELWFTHADLVTLARIQRLRAGLSLNYAAIGLVLDLLDRIDVLERALRTRPREPARSDDQLWISTV